MIDPVGQLEYIIIITDYRLNIIVGFRDDILRVSIELVKLGISLDNYRTLLLVLDE